MSIADASQRLEYNERMLKSELKRIQELTEDFLEEERAKVSEDLSVYLDRKGIPEKLATVRISLSPETKTASFGDLSDADVMKRVRRLYSAAKSANRHGVIYRKTESILTAKRGDDRVRLDKLEEALRKDDSPNTLAFRNKLEAALCRRIREIPVLGSYDHLSNRITLYTETLKIESEKYFAGLKAGDTSYWDETLPKPVGNLLWSNVYTALLSTVFARELFRVLCYRLRKNNNLYGNEETHPGKEVLKDSLAECYARNYAVRTGENRQLGAWYLVEKWMKYRGTAYPAAPALTLFEEAGEAHALEAKCMDERFIAIFRTGLMHWQRAYEMLTGKTAD